jgi:hypothetical protein
MTLRVFIIALSLLYVDARLDDYFIGYVWKIALGVAVLYSIFKTRKLNVGIVVLTLLVFKSFLTLNVLPNLRLNGYFSISVVSLLFGEWLILKGVTYKSIEQIILGVSLAVFVLGVLSSFGYVNPNLSSYNSSTLGLFDNSQSAAKFYFLSAFGVFSIISLGEKYRSIRYFILLIGLLYFCIFSYVRTVWIIIIISFIYFLYENRKSVNLRRYFPYVVFTLGAFVGTISYNYVSFVERIGYRKEVTEADQLIAEMSSGRNFLYEATFNVLKSFDGLELLFGPGALDYLNMFRRYYGVGIFPHNRFLEFLVVTGIFGLVLFTYYVKYKYKRSQTQTQKVLIVVWIITMIPSHGWGVYGNFLFVLIHHYSSYDKRITNSYQSYIQTLL